MPKQSRWRIVGVVTVRVAETIKVPKDSAKTDPERRTTSRRRNRQQRQEIVNVQLGRTSRRERNTTPES